MESEEKKEEREKAERDAVAELAAAIPEFAVREPLAPDESIRGESFTMTDAGYLGAVLRGTPILSIEDERNSPGSVTLPSRPLSY
jgi:hypothetical protein